MQTDPFVDASGRAKAVQYYSSHPHLGISHSQFNPSLPILPEVGQGVLTQPILLSRDMQQKLLAEG